MGGRGREGWGWGQGGSGGWGGGGAWRGRGRRRGEGRLEEGCVRSFTSCDEDHSFRFSFLNGSDGSVNR